MGGSYNDFGVLVAMDQWTRRIVGFGVHRGVDRLSWAGY
jgi:hypothetical protein